MVHNGIEYADMQLIAEAYDLIRRGTGKTPAEIADIFAEWNTGELESYLIEITAEVLRQVDAETGKPLVDVILDQAGAKGTGAWTVQTALDLGVPVSGIAEATFARSLSSHPEQRAVSAPDPEDAFTVADADAFIEQVRLALRVEDRRLLAGLRRDPRRGAVRLDDRPRRDQQDLARGCIIRAQFLNRIADAYAAEPDLAVLLTARTSSTPSAARRTRGAHRRHGRDRRHPAPAFSSSLAYYDGLRASACPPPSSRASATSSARTPTSASTSRHLPHVVRRPHRDRGRRHPLTPVRGATTASRCA
jgi:6-phosphogluconate dehydrogenase